jgi:DNA-binding transcriptional LysR family regulator
VARFRRYHPGVHLYVHTGSIDRILELVAFGSAQVGLIREVAPLRDPRLRVTPLYDEELVLAARPEHPFVAEGPIPMSRLGDATLIFYDRASDDYHQSQAILREAGVTPYGVIEVDSVDTARRLVARGLGVALLPSTSAVPEFEAGRLAPVGLSDGPVVVRRIIAVERAEPSTWAPVITMRRLLGDVATFVPGATGLSG